MADGGLSDHMFWILPGSTAQRWSCSDQWPLLGFQEERPTVKQQSHTTSHPAPARRESFLSTQLSVTLSSPVDRELLSAWLSQMPCHEKGFSLLWLVALERAQSLHQLSNSRAHVLPLTFFFFIDVGGQGYSLSFSSLSFSLVTITS